MRQICRMSHHILSLKSFSSVLCICVEKFTIYSPAIFHFRSTSSSLVIFMPTTGIFCFMRQCILPRPVTHKTLNKLVVQVKSSVVICSYLQLCGVWAFHIVNVEVLVFLNVWEEFLLQLLNHWQRRGYVSLELRNLLTMLHSLTSQ
jgi:hypothetical protein